MQPLSDDLLKGAAAAARYLGLESRWEVYRLTKNGDLPASRKGRLLFYRKSDLDDAFRADPIGARHNAEM